MLSFKRYFQTWAAKRSPQAAQVILRHRTIYVLPSKQGLAFLAAVSLVWLLGTNYQNNLILALSYFLVSLLLVSMIHAFKNMLGLTFVAAATQTAEQGALAPFTVQVRSQYHCDHHALWVALEGGEAARIDFRAGQSAELRLGLPATERGWLKLSRMTVTSYFPFGLVRAWAYVDLLHRALVFPQAIASAEPPLAADEGATGQGCAPRAGDEFQGFQRYQPGASLSQIAWKHYARGAGLQLKDYRAPQAQQIWLDWHSVRAGDSELALSQLCYWVNHLAEANLEFGLILPQQIISQGVGAIHRLEALTALALFGELEI